MENSEVLISIPLSLDPVLVVGVQDEYIRYLEARYHTLISLKDRGILLNGPKSEVSLLTTLFGELIKRLQAGEALNLVSLEQLLNIIDSSTISPSEMREDVLYSHNGKIVRPKTAIQKQYIDSIRKNTITFGIGPAGTGKTYLAMASAIAGLKSGEFKRIILTRPVVEAGESLGFLPGTLDEKIDPYVRPLYDALFDMTDATRAHKMIESEQIEIAPLAYMRGRTLNNSFIILDEAQNTSIDQMKMFLTRLGASSKMVITGDVTQLDIPSRPSGLVRVRPVLEGIDGIAFIEFNSKDVVRHTMVQKIVNAYEHFEEGRTS